MQDTKYGHRIARGADAHKRGLQAESLAEAYLILSGYHILARRYKARGGEVDLIVRKGQDVAIVEVKARKTLQEAQEVLTPRAWARIAAAGADFVAKNAGDLGPQIVFRLDLIAIAPSLQIVHWPCAYEIESDWGN